MSGFRPVRAVGWVTFLEIIRDKVLYNIVLCAFLLLGVGFLAARLSFVRQERIILDFGMSAVNLSCAFLAIFTGAAMVAREFDRRTVFVALSRPVSRFEFVVGKFLGLSGVITLNWLLLSVAFLTILLQSSAHNTDVFSVTLVWGLLLLLLQSIVLASLSVMLSTFSTTSLAVILTIGVYLIGNNISQIRLLATRVHSAVGSVLLNSAATVLPNLEHFNLGLKVTYRLPVAPQFLAGSLIYALCLVALCLVVSGLLIQKRES